MISISNASNQDLDQLKNFFGHYNIDSIIQNRVNCYIEHNHTIIAKDNEKIIGTIQWLVKEDPNLGVVEFEEIHVNFGYQKQGIGTKLMNFAINSVRELFKKNNIKLRKIYLFVSENNLIAQEFYKKFGFKEETKVKNLFSDSENELFFVLNIKV
jgi:ribosomal-protein-alanine N-acetyltransferase